LSPALEGVGGRSTEDIPVIRFIGLSEILFAMASGALVVGTAYLFELAISGFLQVMLSGS
jgi:hypothetical protein